MIAEGIDIALSVSSGHCSSLSLHWRKINTPEDISLPAPQWVEQHPDLKTIEIFTGPGNGETGRRSYAIVVFNQWGVRKSPCHFPRLTSNNLAFRFKSKVAGGNGVCLITVSGLQGRIAKRGLRPNLPFEWSATKTDGVIIPSEQS